MLRFIRGSSQILGRITQYFYLHASNQIIIKISVKYSIYPRFQDIGHFTGSITQVEILWFSPRSVDTFANGVVRQKLH